MWEGNFCLDKSWMLGYEMWGQLDYKDVNIYSSYFLEH